MNIIYLDNNATTQVAPEVVEAMAAAGSLSESQHHFLFHLKASLKRKLKNWLTNAGKIVK